MARSRNRGSQEVNAGSMADIAFLLLIFFLVTTTIASDKGLLITLPPKPDPNEPPPDIKMNERNIFKILANTQDQLMVEDEPMEDISQLRPMVKEFVLNYGKDPKSSDSPKDAIISFKANRGTSYELFTKVLDELFAAYNEMYAQRAGVTVEQWRNIDRKDPVQKAWYDKARKDFPKNISIAQPSKGGN
ncbi:ExbD/TolR family protein [Xanthovirga aplysinae]|uniref:ExbD/TolR family protein n=1 Tax=Xanthovirga aplysinae TaxID=2529853 RepID=UPI0012BCA0B4|nr:biopolymer transporter ExbD [Xanthovirga aplysinae]MTI32791.1 biopolymer transporter ExbD [Xanthovirga aplysinae]